MLLEDQGKCARTAARKEQIATAIPDKGSGAATINRQGYLLKIQQILTDTIFLNPDSNGRDHAVNVKQPFPGARID